MKWYEKYGMICLESHSRGVEYSAEYLEGNIPEGSVAIEHKTYHWGEGGQCTQEEYEEEIFNNILWEMQGELDKLTLEELKEQYTIFFVRRVNWHKGANGVYRARLGFGIFSKKKHKILYVKDGMKAD